MDELERVREEALLTDEKIFEVQQGITWDEYKKEIGASDALLVESYMEDSDFLKMVCEAQLDKALKHKMVRLEAENQELPISTFSCDNAFEAACRFGYATALDDIKKEGWVKCLKKEEHGKRKM